MKAKKCSLLFLREKTKSENIHSIGIIDSNLEQLENYNFELRDEICSSLVIIEPELIYGLDTMNSSKIFVCGTGITNGTKEPSVGYIHLLALSR